MPTGKTPILSFCIPTYNRPDKFERVLKEIIPQLTSETELLIRDDSPDELTANVIKRLLGDSDVNYRYIHGEKIGLDMANIFLIEESCGQYVWWFSDDDELRPGAVAHVLRLIKKYPEISFIWVNFDFQKENNPAIVREEGFFMDGNEVLETLGTAIGLLSTLVFKRAEVLLSLDIARKHARGMSFSGLVPVLTAISGSGKSYFLKGPYILCNPISLEEVKKITTNTGEIKNGAFDAYGIDFYEILMEFKDKFERKSIRKILSVNFAALWRGMLVGWIGGWDAPKGKRWKMFKLYWSFPEFWLALPALLLPLSINKLLFRIYKIFFSHRKWIFGKKSKKQ